MAIAFDTALARQTGTAASVTRAHTTAGTSRVLVVAVGVAAAQTVTGVTYNGVAMTQAAFVLTPDSASNTYHFVLINPASGANNIIASFSASTNYGISSASYTGCRQSDQPDTAVTTVSEVLQTGDRTASVTVLTDQSWLIGGSLYTAIAGSDGFVNAVERTTAVQNDVIDSNGAYAPGVQTIGYHWTVADTHSFFGWALAPTFIKTFDGLAIASVKNRTGLANASVKSWNGLP